MLYQAKYIKRETGVCFHTLKAVLRRLFSRLLAPPLGRLMLYQAKYVKRETGVCFHTLKAVLRRLFSRLLAPKAWKADALPS